jgi:hypothetical protein
MAFSPTSSRHPPAMLYPSLEDHISVDTLFYAPNLVYPVSESPLPTLWSRPPSRYDSSDNPELVRPQQQDEPNRKRHIESVGDPGDTRSFPISSSKRPRNLKRPENAIQETPAFACPLYKHNPSRFGGPRGCADWCTLEIHRLYSVRQPHYYLDSQIAGPKLTVS